MKNLFYITMLLVLIACTGSKENEKKTFKVVNNEIVTVIVDATKFGFPVKVGSLQDWIYLYEKEKAKGIDTIQLKVFPMDLLMVGYPHYSYGTNLMDTLLVTSSDTIFAKITKKNLETSVFRKGKKVNVKWNDAKLLPKNEDYVIIEELHKFRKEILPLPPPLKNSPKKLQKEAKEKIKEFLVRKKKSSIDIIKKNPQKYFQGIQNYYQNRLIEVAKVQDSIKQNFYKSYILYKEYAELQKLQNLVRKQEYFDTLKGFYDKQTKIDGVFAKKVALEYIFHNIFANRNSKTPYSLLYDSIIPQDFEKHQKVLRQRTINEMIFKRYPREDIKTYIDKFISQYGTNDKIEEFKKDIEYDLKVTNDLNLVATDGTKITFEELRKKHKGKVLYVDFWASWCHPCRLMLPESAKLHKELHNKDIVFIYLALGDKEKVWKIACKDEKLYENSYRIINSKTSTFIEKMKIASIPHYMIYDKSGKLFQNNAPRPHTEVIRKILKDLVK